ncbi:MAG: glycine oxidase ThiO [Gemmatimonadota bacterium]
MSRRRNRAELVVVGGGVIGLAVARVAAELELDVLVLERGRVGSEASHAAAGMLSPIGEALDPGPFLDFGLRSLRSYPAFAVELEEESGVEVGFEGGGKVRVALSPAEEGRLRRHHAWSARSGFTTRWLDPAELARAEPAVAPEARGGLLIEGDCRVDNRALVQALLISARRRGVEIREGEPVRGVQGEGGRIRGVRLSDGGIVEADTVLLAAGAWCAELEGLPFPIPIRPVRGQAVSLRPAAPISGRVLESEEVYLVPRRDGRLIAGATVEEVGFRRELTAGGQASVLTAAIALAPELANARLEESWAGFRPGTPDGLPILGEDPDMAGLFVATGHFRNGILLAPETGRTLAHAIAGSGEDGPPEAFSPSRLRKARA